MADDSDTDRDIDRDTDGALDALLTEARGQRPSDDLVARVLADAKAVQQAAQPPQRVPTRRGGVWRNPPGFVAALGGWGGFGGVTAAGLFGLALGFWSPEAVDSLSGGQFGLTSEAGWTPDLAALAWEADDV
jgi:hypothetical protein